MNRFRSLAIAIAVTAVFVGTPLARAQSIDDIQRQDADLGPGCNAIALAVPNRDVPISPGADWLDAHSACDGSGDTRLHAGGFCAGYTDGIQQLDVCNLSILEGERPITIGCDAFSLQTTDGLYGVQHDVTLMALDTLKKASEDHDLTLMDKATPCSTQTQLKAGNSIVAAFLPTPTDAPIALIVDIGPGKRFAFIVTDAPLRMSS